MKKIYLAAACALLCTCVFFFYNSGSSNHQGDPVLSLEKKKKTVGYDGPAERDDLEFEKTVDPALGYVPAERLFNAIEYTENEKKKARNARQQGMLLWTERGPIYDTVGPSNGNSRAGVNYTAGRIRAMLVDTLADPSGNTVFAGGVSGGLWKTTNFLSAVPNWEAINDYFDNLAISSITQNPSDPDEMYFATGEPTVNADAVNGAGIWKSTDHGKNWMRLPGTHQLVRSFKIVCDNNGNVYLAARTTTVPVFQPHGLFRSKDGGATWTNITPTGLTSNNSCMDLELSKTGRFHASFGYRGSVVNHRYTDDPANVSSASGWNASTGINPTNLIANRLDLDVVGNVVYAVTISSANNIDYAYKSVDGGATFARQNTIAYPAALTNTQGWYNVAIAVNPENTNEFIVGGLDAYRSTNSGATITRTTNWVASTPYVHADHHNMFWWKARNGESRVLIACDGGLFLSRNNGVDWQDKNRNLAIKQFYAAAIHPEAGSNYLLAGAQDNGTHQLKYPGLSSSVEVTGGDGCYVHINQKNPLVQFGSYVYNQYRRSLDGGKTWSSINFSNGAQGMFVNPFDYDDNKNIMYACWATNTILRWMGANTGTSANTLAIPGLGAPAAFKVSPHTADRVFIGSNTGRIFRLDRANTATPATVATDAKNITGASFPFGFINSVNVGTTDDYLVATFTNYGINNVWYSKDGGTSWSAVDGNLPDMPVRWGMFVPGQDDKLIIATEAGVYTTQAVDGAKTVWSVNPGFPTVKTNMLKMRTSDNTVVAATHGRGLFTAVIPTTETPDVVFSTASTTVSEAGETLAGCRGYKDHRVNVGILNPATGDATVTYNVKGPGTAVKGVDFDLTTNGDFSNPSGSHVFSAGSTAAKVVTVRVYDDAEIEPEEFFTISFSISGNTNAVAGTTSTHKFSISDNGERAPKVYEYASYAIGTYDNTNLSVLNNPFDGRKLKHRIQMLYTAAELRAKGLDAQALISSLSVFVKTKNTTKPFNNLNISLSNNGVSSFGNYVGGTFTTVYSGNYSTIAGNNTFDFVQPFSWDGVSNIVVQFCFDNTASGVDVAADVVEGNAAPLGAGNYASVYSDHTTSAAPGCAIGASWRSFNRLNATFSAIFGNRIATATGTSKTEYLNSDNDIYFYSADSAQVLARVRNLSAHNYGCTDVTIDREGTGATKFWNSNKKNFLMNKTYRILPAVNDPKGLYEVTFYFTKEEKEGWEAATGQSWSEIQIVKVSNTVGEVTPSNAQPNNNGTVEEVGNAVHGTFGTGYTLTYAFASGFGGFGFGTPGRQFTNLFVEANHAGGQSGRANTTVTDIDVSWTTSSESGSTIFEVEKSYDGVNFRKVGTVRASGNKSTPTTYHFMDGENVELNYYRIKMLHTDDYVLMSKTALVKNRTAVQNMFVLTNPFRSEIKLRFSKVPKSQVVFSLYDMSGKLVKRYTQSMGADVAVFNTSTSNLASNGVYLLDVYVDGQHYKAKVVKQ